MDKSFVLERINVFAGQPIDPASDLEVKQLLRNKFNIALPQRRTLNESLEAVASDHDVIDLIIQYRQQL